jgi:hypothetical protein
MADFNKKDSKKDKDKKEKHRRVVSEVRQFMHKSSEYRKPHVELSKKSREIYENWSAQGRTVTHRANIKLPYGFSIIEDQTPKIVQALLQDRPLVVFEAENESVLDWEDSLDDFHDAQLEEMKFIPQVPAAVKSMLLDGTIIAKIPYKFEEDLLTWESAEIVGNEVKLVEQEELVVKHDGPAFELIPFIDFYPDWRVKVCGDVKSMRGCVHRTWRTISELEGNRNYDNIKELKESVQLKGHGVGCAWKAPYYSEEAQQDYDRLNDNKPLVKNQDEVEIWEYWGLIDEDGEGNYEEYLVTIGNGDTVLRCDKNPFKHKIRPFVAAPNVVRDNEFYGIPELVAVRGLIKEANALRNANLDQVNLAINRMFIADRNAGIKAKQLFSRPNGIIWANDINGIRELPPAMLNGDSVRSGQEIQGDIQNALGTTNSTPQLPQMARTFGRSATGVEFINSVTASRASLKLFMLSEWMLKPMYEIMLQMNNQYVTQDQWVRSQDPNSSMENPFSFLPVDAFAKLDTFRLRSSIDTGGSENIFNKLQALGGILQTAESTQPGIVDWEKFFDATGRSLLGKRYQKFIRSPEERQMLQAQTMAMEQSAQVQAGQNAPQPASDPGVPPVAV